LFTGIKRYSVARAAGAGTGKTKTLAHRVARLILGGTDPRRLLLLTFTRCAALEMTRRAQQILVVSQRGRAAGDPEAALLPWSGTFHSIGNRLLRRHAALGISVLLPNDVAPTEMRAEACGGN
jgi:DNA helicase-2/ATP-dependent DNA helicase PcrA